MANYDYQEIIDNLYEGVYMVDRDRRIISWNNGAKRITGFSAEDTVGRYCHDNILNHIDEYGKQLCLIGCPLHQTSIDGEVREMSAYLQHKRGHRIPVKVKAMPLFDDGELVGTIEIFTEIGDHPYAIKQLSAIQTRSLKDSLTGIPNKQYIDHSLNSKMNDFRMIGVTFGIVMIDIDNFDGVNKTFGREKCDELLVVLSQSLSSAFRMADLVGRWKADEFLVIFSGVNTESMEMLCEKIRIIAEHTSLRDVSPKDIDITVSIGATLVRHDDTIDRIVNRTIDNLKRAKTKGGNMIITK